MLLYRSVKLNLLENFKDLVNMKPAIVADEMFPEGAGSYMDLEEVI